MYLLWIVFVQNQCYSEGQGGFGVPNIFFPTLFPAPLWPGQLFCRSFSQLGVLNCSPPSETQSSFRPEVRITEHTLGTFSPHSFWSSPLGFLGWSSVDGVMRGIPKDNMTAMLQDLKRMEWSVAMVNMLGGQQQGHRLLWIWSGRNIQKCTTSSHWWWSQVSAEGPISLISDRTPEQILSVLDVS